MLIFNDLPGSIYSSYFLVQLLNNLTIPFFFSTLLFLRLSFHFFKLENCSARDETSSKTRHDSSFLSTVLSLEVRFPNPQSQGNIKYTSLEEKQSSLYSRTKKRKTRPANDETQASRKTRPERLAWSSRPAFGDQRRLGWCSDL